MRRKWEVVVHRTLKKKKKKIVKNIKLKKLFGIIPELVLIFWQMLKLQLPTL